MAGLTRPSPCNLRSTPRKCPGGPRLPRADWQRLSSGVGIPPGSDFPFPSIKVRSTLHESLPPAAEQDSRVLDFDEVLGRWETSTGAAHGPKTHGGIYEQRAYSLTARVGKTLGIKKSAELQLRPCRNPLTMANQTSEMKEKYQGHPQPRPEPVRWELAHHHKQGPSLTRNPSSKSPAVSGMPFYIPDLGVLDHRQPSLTTTARDFGYCSRKERAAGYRKIDKVFKQRRLEPPEPLARGAHLGQAYRRVPHRGALSQTQESYPPGQHPLRLADRFCPIDVPWAQVKPVLALQTVPHVYQTENARYGSSKHTFV
ncbi:stabilizer of axonemal microtubules 3-like isoform X1 [Macrotis lagotis]|uniref:stabilizer of axonemal microtubules 3-like isoform X1 n=1 Tax=Macrotis lagotis TaxID=92651 RepID=UPI003D68454F